MIKDGSAKNEKNFGEILRVNEDEVRGQLEDMVRGTVEETLNAMLDEEADKQIGAKKYERRSDRKDTRAGHYERKLLTRAGKVNLKVPKLRKLTFESAIIKRYQMREISVEEALIEMYLAGVSVRRVEDITEALWGSKVSPGTVSNLNKKIYVKIEEWRNKPIEREHAYVYLDGIWLKRSWAGEVTNVSVLVAIGVDKGGYREMLGVCEGGKEDKESWRQFLRHLKDRGLKGVKLIISDKCLGLLEAIGEVYPEAKWQRCIVHFYRNVFTVTPKNKVKDVAAMLKAIHAQEDLKEARKKAEAVAAKLELMKLTKAAKKVREGIDETLEYMNFHREHWMRIRTNNPLERIMREIRRRTRVVGCFPDGESALMLVAARLRHVAGTKWGMRKYLDMDKLNETELEERAA
jgi:transposase-like protein